jgi:hypothetical protein
LIVKCSYCHQIFAEESFDSHVCNVPINNTKKINVAYFRDDTQNGKKRVTVRGIDGTLYVFEAVPRKAIPITIPLSRRKVTAFKTDEDETEPVINSSHVRALWCHNLR